MTERRKRCLAACVFCDWSWWPSGSSDDGHMNQRLSAGEKNSQKTQLLNCHKWAEEKDCIQQQQGIFESWQRRTLKHASSESRKQLYEVSMQDRKEETNKMTRRKMRKGLNEWKLNYEANILLASNYRKTISMQNCSHPKWHVALTSEKKSRITNIWIEETYRSAAIICRKMVHNVKVN